MSRIRRPYKVIFTYNVRIHWIITTGNLVYRIRSSVINNLNNSLRYTLVIDSLQKDRPTIHLVRLRLCVKYAFIPMPMRCPTYNIYEIRINHRNKFAQSLHRDSGKGHCQCCCNAKCGVARVFTLGVGGGMADGVVLIITFMHSLPSNFLFDYILYGCRSVWL